MEIFQKYLSNSRAKVSLSWLCALACLIALQTTRCPSIRA